MRSLLALALASALAVAPAWAEPPRVVAAGPDSPPPLLAGELVLSPRQFAQLAAVRNPEVRYSRLGVDVAGYLSTAESALYEAVLFASVRGSDLSRQRTVEERLSSSAALSVLDERSASAEAGLRPRLPSAGEVSASYRIVRRATNIIASAAGQGRDTEWTGSLILNLKQPLLKNSGRSVLETDKRVAELEYQVQWTQFRQQVLKSTIDALNLYWQLARAQDARRMRDESLRNVRRITQDVQARIEAGRAPRVNELEAGSTVLARESELTRADQAVREAESRVLTTLGIASTAQSVVRLKVALDVPPPLPDSESLEAALDRALLQWPPFLVSRLRLEQGRARLNYAASQREPSLDFNVSYAANGLSYYRAEARQLATSDKYPEWVVGLNFEMPLGGKRAYGQYEAQATRVAQNELELEAIRTSLANDLAQRREELANTLRLVQQMQGDLVLRQKLVDAERDRYNLGVGQLSQWLQRENELLEARQRLGEAMMRAHMARAAWLFAQGTLLDEYDIAVRNE
jgi:outer membrane protein TolC